MSESVTTYLRPKYLMESIKSNRKYYDADVITKNGRNCIEGLYQGDIVLDPDEKVHIKNGSRTFASIKGGNWPGGVVPYVILKSIGTPGRMAVEIAIERYERFTCLRFKKRTTEREYVVFTDGSGCSSPVGYRKGRVNYVTLERLCRNYGTVMHEIGHSIGFYHEQSRPDRDDYIRVHIRNIKPGYEFAFTKKSDYEIDSLGTPYDLRSIMHYGLDAFSKNGKNTIEVLDYKKRFLIGNRNRLSDIDIQQINLKYNCGITRTFPPYVCEDDFDTCAKHKAEGKCGEKSMFIHCCLTCGYGEAEPTKVPQPGDCVNEYGTNDCIDRARLGDCTAPMMKDMMKNRCCKTCKDFMEK